MTNIVRGLHTRWALVVGDPRTGKTSLVRVAVEHLAAHGLRVAGVVQEAIEREGERVAYEAVRLTHGADRVVVARRGAADAGEPICSYAFDDAAFMEVAAWLEHDATDADVIVVDEVSKVEWRGRGHAAAIGTALRGRAPVVLAVRASELSNVIERFGLGEPIATLRTADAAVSDDARAAAVRDLVDALVAAAPAR